MTVTCCQSGVSVTTLEALRTRVAPVYSRTRMEAFPVPVSERTHAVAV